MKKSRWKEREIEDLLRQLPEVKDKRSKKEVFSRIEGKQRRNRKKLWIPRIVGIASLFLMMIIGSSLMIGKDESQEQEVNSHGNGKLAISESKIILDKQEKHDIESNEKQEVKEDIEGEPIEKNELKSKSQQVEKEKTPIRAIYSEDLQGKSTITLGVPDHQQNFIVPLSFVVDTIEETEALDQVVKKMSTINEKKYGLSDYFPLDIKVSHVPTNNTANIELRAGSNLLDEDIVFLRTMEETLSYLNIDKVTFTTDGKSGASFAHAGTVIEEEIPQHKNRTFFLYHTDKSSSSFLVPSNIDYQNMEEALQAAKEEPGIEGISSALPESLKWENLRYDGGLVTVELAQEGRLKNDSESLQGLEVILFTAKDFGYAKVKFENSPVEMVGSLNLSEEITVPVAPNLVN